MTLHKMLAERICKDTDDGFCACDVDLSAYRSLHCSNDARVDTGKWILDRYGIKII